MCFAKKKVDRCCCSPPPTVRAPSGVSAAFVLFAIGMNIIPGVQQQNGETRQSVLSGQHHAPPLQPDPGADGGSGGSGGSEKRQKSRHRASVACATCRERRVRVSQFPPCRRRERVCVGERGSVIEGPPKLRCRRSVLFHRAVRNACSAGARQPSA